MVTVIAAKEELTTPVNTSNNNNGVASNDNERPFQFIKDYQEVDFRRSASCKPLPEDLFETMDGQNVKSSIKGTFFVQIDDIEPVTQVSNTNQEQPTNEGGGSLLIAITDGITNVKCLTLDEIPNLSLNTRIGSKLLLTGSISVKDGLLQLTHDNTRFRYGSSTYPRPRSAYRGRGGGSYRSSFEGRRGSRYDNDDEESNFFKRPPPKNTLMDFMSGALKLNDTKQDDDGENLKTKERNEGRRRPNHEQYYAKNGNGTTTTTTTNSSLTNNSMNNLSSSHGQFYPSNKSLSSSSNQSMNNNNNPNYYSTSTIYGEQSQQDGNYHQMHASNEQLDGEDDPAHGIYRERRNPLPPRLQRAQEERSRRNTNRYYDDAASLSGSEINGIYRNGTTNSHSLSSSTPYYRRGDPTSYLTNTTVTGPHSNLNAYAQPHANMFPSVNGSTPTHLAYFQTNPGALTYSLAGISTPSFQQQQLATSYTNDHLTFCYGPAYATTSYPPPPTVVNGFVNGDSKTFLNNNNMCQPSASIDEIEPTGSQQDDNDIENKPIQSTDEEQKQTTTSPPSSSSETSSSISQSVTNEQHEEKRRDSTNLTRPRWRVGDMCLARWREDGEFYCATIIQIQPPFCVVLFRDYNNYDRVHFAELKILPRDQQYCQFISPAPVPPALAAAAFFQPRTGYFPPGTTDGCILMPEAPPFPFNSAGTLFMCPSTTTTQTTTRLIHSTGDNLSTLKRTENENNNNLSSSSSISSSSMNNNNNTTLSSSTSPLSKDNSNDTSAIDDINQQNIQLTETNICCSLADAPLSLVIDDDQRERSTSTESIPSSKLDEQQSTKEEEEEEEDQEDQED